MSDVFISHVEEDGDLALEIARGLKDAGYSTWCYEEDHISAIPYLLQTGQEIEKCAAFLLVISAHSMGSNQVTKEVERAHECAKPFIPVLNGLTHVEFQARQPAWRQAVGTATSTSVPREGASVIVPRIVAGLRALGIEPHAATTSAAVATPPAGAPRASRDSSYSSDTAGRPAGIREAPRRHVPMRTVMVALLAALAMAAGWVAFRGISSRKGATSTAAAGPAFGKPEASLIIAGMYLGQAAIRHGSLSESARSEFEKRVAAAAIGDGTLRAIAQSLDEAASSASISQGMTLVGEAANELMSAAEEASPAFGKEAAKLGFNLGIVTMGINACVDMPERSPAGVAPVESINKVLRSPSFSTIREVEPAVPFPPVMHDCIERMFEPDVNTLKGCEQIVRAASLLSFYLWTVADEGPEELARLPVSSQNEFASRMSIRLEMDGFAVTIPGIPPRIPAFSAGPEKGASRAPGS